MQLEPRPITGFFQCSYVLVSSTWQVNHFNLFWYKTELTNLCNIINLKKNVLSFMDTKWKLLTFGQILCWHLSHRNMPLPCFPSCITWPATRMVSAFSAFNLWWRDFVDLSGGSHLFALSVGVEALVSCGMMECLLKVINWYGDGQEHITVSKTDSLYICSFFSVQERQCQEKKMYLLNCDHGWLFSS